VAGFGAASGRSAAGQIEKKIPDWSFLNKNEYRMSQQGDYLWH